MQSATRERILDGAAQALARFGLAKLDMRDVSATSGVSRGTLYRYFPGRDVLLAQLARHEGQRFRDQVWQAMAATSPGPARLRVALEYATRHVREHPALQRLLETDAASVLMGLRREFPTLKAELAHALAPALSDLPVLRATISTDQIVDWTLRLMISAYLLPERGGDDMARGLASVYEALLSAAPATPAGPPPTRRRPRTAPDSAPAPARNARPKRTPPGRRRPAPR